MSLTHESDSNSGHGPASMAGVGTHEVVLELVQRLLPEPSSLLDLAAGEGAFSVRLQELGHKVVAVDASRDNWKVPDIPLNLTDLDSDFSTSLAGGQELYDGI